MSSLTHVIADVRRIRERFLEGSVEAETLRPTVVESWRRSQALRVHPDRLALPYVRELNTESRLIHAAAPVLRQITDDLAAEAVTVILTSADGVVLQRAVSEGTFMKALDSVSLAPGYSYAEEFAGTNGIGTALETGQPAFIRGSEHFVGKLDRLACAGAPIRDPISQRVVGVVDLTCWASHSDPLLFALAKNAGSWTEERMKASAHESEVALVDAYHQQARRFPLGVLAIGGDVVLMNRYLRQALNAVDQTALLEYAADLLFAKASDALMAVLPSGTTAKLSVADRAQFGGARANVVFHIRLSAETTAQRIGIRQRTVTRIPGLAGRSSSWRRSCQQVERCCGDGDWVLIEGEKGSGRAKLAQAVGEYVNPGRTVRVMRVENFSTAGRFVADLVSATDDDDFLLVLADVDAIDEEALEPIAAVLQSRAGRGWIAATTSCATPTPTIEALLLPFFTHTVTVPPLRHRIEDIEELVPLLLGEVASGAQVKLAPEAMRQLSRMPWPGNVAQLRRVLLETVARQRSGLIDVDKLPPECRSVTRRKLTQMEALERDAIVRSLEENGGKKLEAALALGMSRATIYRKMNEYGIA
jgi:sigma-54 dependent transcriptional regulator, acetoin dehydrogenase operon transcriptional activator AcoR